MIAWQPSGSVDAARSRAALQQRIRSYFTKQEVLEVDTPALSHYGVTDTQIDSFAINSQLSREPLYLHTSPEYAMKRLLAAGFPDCFSIARVFRDAESGRNHQPEFTLVEWYRLRMTLTQIIADTVALIVHALQEEQLSTTVQTVEYRELFARRYGIDLHSATTDELATAANASEDLRASLGDDKNDWLDYLMATDVCKTFAKNSLTVVQHYPAEQAALARLCPNDNRLADRFEVFYGDAELANGYVELVDSDEQEQRMIKDQQHRRQRGREPMRKDRTLLAALKHGMPPCAGVAMGLERLQMVHDNRDDIAQVVTFTYGEDSGR